MARRYLTAADRRRQDEAKAKGETYLPGGAALSLADVALVLKSAQEGRTQTELAELFHVAQSTISRVLADFQDSRPLAKARLHASADDLARTAIRAAEKGAGRGDGSVALELLDRLEVAPRRGQDAPGSARVVVVVGDTDHRRLPPGLIVDIPALPAQD